MQNCLAHHLISTKLHYALPKYTLVQNYCEPWLAYVHCQPQKYYTLCTTCLHLLSTYPLLKTQQIFWCRGATSQKCLLYILVPPNTDKKCPFCACSMWTTKKWKMSGATLTSHGHRSSLCTMVHYAGWWCTTQVSGAHHSSVLLR